MPWPLGDMTGPDQLYDTCYKPLLRSVPDLERRLDSCWRFNKAAMNGSVVAVITLEHLRHLGLIYHQQVI